MRKFGGNLLKDQARWAGRARQEAAWRGGWHGHDSMKYSSELRFSGGDLAALVPRPGLGGGEADEPGGLGRPGG